MVVRGRTRNAIGPQGRVGSTPTISADRTAVLSVMRLSEIIRCGGTGYLRQFLISQESASCEIKSLRLDAQLAEKKMLHTQPARARNKSCAVEVVACGVCEAHFWSVVKNEYRRNKMRYDTIIFDMDGTLLNTLDDLVDSVNHMLQRYGYSRKEEKEVRRALGNGARVLIGSLLPQGEENPQFEQIYQEYVTYYQEHCQIKTRPYDGMMETLRELKKRNIRMGIVSNKGDGAVKELSRKYFSECIDIAVGDRPGEIRRKPEPDSVLEAVRLLGGSLENTLYVGDSEVDYQTGQNGQFACTLVSWGFRDRTFLESLHPDYLIDRPEELLEISETGKSSEL